MDNRTVCVILLLISTIAILTPTCFIMFQDDSPKLFIRDSKEIDLYSDETGSKINGTILLEGDEHVSHVIISAHYYLPEEDNSGIIIGFDTSIENQLFCGTYNGKPYKSAWYRENYNELQILDVEKMRHPKTFQGEFLYEFDVNTEDRDDICITIYFSSHLEGGVYYIGAIKKDFVFTIEKE